MFFGVIHAVMSQQYGGGWQVKLGDTVSNTYPTVLQLLQSLEETSHATPHDPLPSAPPVESHTHPVLPSGLEALQEASSWQAPHCFEQSSA